MPGLKGKGPVEKGPLTGGQRDVCRQTKTDKTNQLPDTTEDVVPDQGRGGGRCQGGSGRGFGKGQGRGQARGGKR